MRNLLEGAGQQKEAVDRYVMLEQVMDWAVRSGDVDAANQAVDAIASVYPVDELALRLEVIAGCYGKPGTDKKAFASKMLYIKIAAEEKKRFDIAAKAALMLLNYDKSINDKTSIPQSQADHNRFKELAARQENAQRARNALRENPANREASQIWGEFLCFYCGDWEQGLPWLAQSENKNVAELAELEKRGVGSAEAQFKLAERWFELSEGTDDELRARGMQQRAFAWYQASQNNLDGKQRERCRQRLELLERKLKK